jgi:hypothetical protein
MPESLDLKGSYQYFPLPHYYAKIARLAGVFSGAVKRYNEHGLVTTLSNELKKRDF